MIAILWVNRGQTTGLPAFGQDQEKIRNTYISKAWNVGFLLSIAAIIAKVTTLEYDIRDGRPKVCGTD
jgi:hypothetical protein